MVTYQLSTSLDFSSPLDLTGVVDTRKTSIQMNGCSTSFTSAQDSVSFTVRNIESPKRSNAITLLLDAYENGTEVYGRIVDNGTYLFVGIVDLTGLSIASTAIAGPLTIKLLDFAKKYLDVAPKRNIVIENVKISTVVNTLLGYAGCTIGTISIDNDDDVTLPCFVVDKDDDQTYRAILDKLLLEAGLYYFSFDNLGQCNVQAVILSANSGIVPNYKVSSGLETTGSSLLESKGLRVQWSTAAAKADQIIYVDNISKKFADNGYSVIGTEIQKDAYYPADGDVDPIYQEYSVDFLDRAYMSGASRKKNEDLSLLMARDVTMSVQFTDENGQTLDTADCIEYPASPFTEEPTNPIMYAKKAFVLMKALQDCYILHFQMKGTVRYRDVSYISSIGDTSSDPIEYTSEYIFTKTHAEKFAQRYWQMKQMCRLVHKWTDLDNLAIGSVVQIAHKDTSVSQYAYIVSKTSTFVGGVWQYQYSAVSIGSWNAGTVATRGTSLEKGQTGSVTIQYSWSNSSVLPPSDGWTAQPTARTDARPYQWMRTSTDNGETWSYSCITGADGITIQYEYQYGDDADNPPTGTWYTAAEFPYAYETYNIVWGEYTCLYDGDNMVLAADATKGAYLWQRISADGGTTWTYARLTGEAGEDAKYFRISSTTATFEQNARMDGNQTLVFDLETSGYTSVSVTKWQVKLGSGGAYADIAGETGTTLSYAQIPYNNSYDTVSFKVVADCDGTSTTAEISLNVVVTTNLNYYWGALASAPTGTALNRPIDGDYYLNTGDSYPYVMSSGSWVLLDANSDTDWGMKVANILANAGDTLPSDSSLYTWCQNLVAKNGFIENLETKKIHINSGGAIYTGGFDANGNYDGSSDGVYISESTNKFAGEVELMQNGETVFKTQRKVESGPYTGSNSTGYTEYCTATDFLDNAPLLGYTTIDGHTITYAGNTYNSIAATSAGSYEKYWYYEYTLTLVSETQTFTAPYDGYLNVGIMPITYVNSMTVTVGGTSVPVSVSFTVKNYAVTKGQTIVVTTNVTAGYGAPWVYLYIHSGVQASADILVLLTANGMTEKTTTGSDVLLITDSNNNTVFDSSNYTKTLYTFDTSLLPLADAEVNDSTSTVTVGGTTIAPVSMTHSGGAIIFTDANDVSLSLYNGMADTYSFTIYCTPATDGVYVSHLFTDNFIGMVAYFYISENDVPEGWIALNASKKIRETEYPKLFAVLATIGNSYVTLASDTKGNYYTLPDLATYDNSTGEGGYFIRSGVTSLIGKTEMDEIRAIRGYTESAGEQASNTVQSNWVYAEGAFSVVAGKTVPNESNDYSSDAKPWAFEFDANDGTTATNPMADHADGNDIHPYNVRLLPCIYAGE